MSRRAIVLSAGTLVVLLSSVALGAQGPWSLPATPLVDGGGPSREAQIAVAPDGLAVAVWRRGPNNQPAAIEAAVRPAGGVFGPVITLSQLGASGPQVALAPDGTATVVWERFAAGLGRVEASSRVPGGSFPAPADVDVLSDVLPIAQFPQVAVAPNGATTVAWAEGAASNATLIKTVTRLSGIDFPAPGAAVALTNASNNQPADPPALSVGADGTTVVAWARDTDAGVTGKYVIEAAVRPPGGAFPTAGSAAVLSSDADDNASGPQVAVAPDGAATVIWQRDANAAGNLVEASTRPAGGAFPTPTGVVVLSGSPSTSASSAHLAVAHDGSLTAVWEQSGTNATVIRAATRPSGGAFPPPTSAVTLSRDVNLQPALAPRVATGTDGTTTVVWSRRTGPSTETVEAATRPPGGSFPAPASVDVISDAIESSRFPQVAIMPGGGALAVWQKVSQLDDRISWAQTANTPFNSGLPVASGTGAVGQTLSCVGGLVWTNAASVDPLLRWVRGSTEVGTGSSYTVTSADRGSSLVCRETATNTFGTTNADSNAITIPPPPVASSSPPPPAVTTTTGPKPLAPTVVARAKILGPARVGKVLRCSGARFTGATSRRTAWLRNKKVIPGAGRASYRLKKADRGKNVACRVIGTGPGGKATTVSKAVLVK